MNRRGFLKSAGIILAAPAIVKAENIMKIWTPPKDIILPENDSLVFVNGVLQEPARQFVPSDAGYYTVSYHMKAGDGQWEHHQELRYLENTQSEIKIMFPKQFSNIPKLSIASVQLERIRG